MDALVMSPTPSPSSSSYTSSFYPRFLFQSLSQREAILLKQKTITCRCFFSDEFHSQKQLRFYVGSGNRTRSLVIAAAKKKKSSKLDNHSFTPKPDEATGPFPEAVLLKKKIVQEDGGVLPEFADAEEEMFFEFLSLQLESDLNADRTRHYEVVYLIHEDCLDEVESVVSKVQDFVREKKGKIWRLNNWGLRRLAYKIKKAKNANYILMNFELEAKWINDFKSMLDRDERVIRHLVIKRDEAITKDCPPPPEFHTLREGGLDDEDESDEEDFDDEDEVEMASYDDEDDIILVDEDGEQEEVDEYKEHKGSEMFKVKEMVR